MNIDLDFVLMIPEFMLIGAALVVLLLDAIQTPQDGSKDGTPNEGGAATSTVTVISVLGCFGAALWTALVLWDGGTQISFGGLFVLDTFIMFVKVLVAVAAGLALLLSDPWLKNHRLSAAGHHALLLMATSGMLYMLSAGDFVMLFMGLEVMSIPLYCLAAFLRWEDRSVEAGVKYLVLGSFATAVMLFGMVLIYGWVGLESGTPTMNIAAILEVVRSADALPGYAVMGGFMLLVGLLFKVSAAPFHMWTPDVYEGAPTPITAYMSVAVKAVGAAVILRLFGSDILAAFHLEGVLWGVIALTLVIGNVMALAQNNVKRMLAYSSIAHGGYMLMGVLAGTPAGQAGVLFYIVAYTAANMAAFGVLVYFSRRGHDVETFDDLRGLGRHYPFAAAVTTLSMLSLMGIPPLAGFFGKFQIFAATIAEGYIVLAVLGILMSALSVGYYLRPVVVLYMSDHVAPTRAPESANLGLMASLGLSAAAIVIIGLLPESYLQLAAESVRALAG
jgi:NADH-quinone oxidoreductase subunit N